MTQNSTSLGEACVNTCENFVHSIKKMKQDIKKLDITKLFNSDKHEDKDKNENIIFCPPINRNHVSIKDKQQQEKEQQKEKEKQKEKEQQEEDKLLSQKRLVFDDYTRCYLARGLHTVITNFQVRVIKQASYVLHSPAIVEFMITGNVRHGDYQVNLKRPRLFLHPTSHHDNIPFIQVFTNFLTTYSSRDSLNNNINDNNNNNHLTHFTVIEQIEMAIDLSNKYNFFIKDDNQKTLTCSSVINIY